MAYDGWLSFGGSEIINAERTAAYIGALTPRLGFTDCSVCPGMRYLVNRKRNPGTIAPTNDNLLTGDDANFELGTTGRWSFNNFWGGATGTIANSSVRASVGTKSMLVTWPTHTGNEWVPIEVSGLTVGDPYLMSMDVWVPSGSPDVAIASPFLTANEVFTSVKGAWVTLTQKFIATWPFNNIGLWVSAATTSGQQVWVDNVSVVPYAYPPMSGDFIEESTKYTTPLADQPDWFDLDDPDTWGFAGLYPLGIRGLDDDTRSATVVESSDDGGSVLLPRKATREVIVSGLLIADSDPALNSGLRWLRKALEGSGCTDGGSCEGDDLCFFVACPESSPLHGYDYTGPAAKTLIPGAYGWQAFGGTYSRNMNTGVGTYTSANAGVDYLQYSPFHTACDHMKFTVTFPPQDLGALLRRTNMVPNPSYRAASSSIVVRRNLMRNPVGKYNANYWTGVSSLGAGYISGQNIEAKEGGSSPNYPGQIGLQARYVRSEANKTINRAGAGLRFYADQIEPGVPLLISSLVKTQITGVTKVQFKVTCLNEDGDPIAGGFTTGAEQTVVPNTWIRLNELVTPVAGTTDVAVDIVVGASIAGTFTNTQNTMYASEVLVEHLSAVPNWDTPFFFTGDIGYLANGLTRGWENTPHASASILTGPALPNTLVGKDVWVSSTNFAHVRSYRYGSNESMVYISALSGFTNTNPIMESVNLPVIAGKSFYGARVRVQHIDGPQAALGVVLRLRAYNSVGTDLGIIATTADTAVPLSVGGTVNVTAPSSATLPGGTSYLKAEVWLNTGATVVPTILKVSQFLVEPVAANSTQPGSFFDGDTPNDATYEYDWTGSPNASTSIQQDPIEALPNNVRLEAWGATAADPSNLSTRLGGVESSTSVGEVSLTVSGCEWETVAWRLVPLDTAAMPISSVVTEWHEDYGYSEVLVDWTTMHPYGYYTELPPGGLASDAADPIVESLDRISGKYMRSLRRVTAVSGPTVTQRYSARSAHIAKVEFTLIAGVPHLYGNEVDVGSISLSATGLAGKNYSDTSFIINEAIPDCVVSGSSAAVIDPACAAVPTPPQVPDIMQVCSPSAGPILHRYGIRIDAKDIPQWGDVVPIITLKPVSAVSQVRLRFYPTPVQYTVPGDLDPCSACAGLVINYSDVNGIVIDGSTERVYSPIDETNNGVPTGRVVERNARHLVTNTEFGPFQWPVLSCGVGYLVVVETYQNVDTTLDIRLVARQ